MKQIRVLVYPVGEEPHEEMIDNTLEASQKIVGGYIEYVNLFGSVDLVCNEEGLLEKLPFNRVVLGHYIVGQFFITRTTPAGNQTSLTPTDIRRARTLIG